MATTVPSPGADSMVRVPCCATTLSRSERNPNPLPSALPATVSASFNPLGHDYVNACRLYRARLVEVGHRGHQHDAPAAQGVDDIG